jgi:hypothetical protein
MTNEQTKSTQATERSDKTDDMPMSKPSALWMLVPILLIALAVLLAR